MAGREAGKTPPAAGHNSARAATGETFGGPLLRQFFERIQRLNAEIAELNADKSQVFTEVKAHGFDLPVFRTVVSRAQQDRADLTERDTMIALYEDAIFGPSKPAESEG